MSKIQEKNRNRLKQFAKFANIVKNKKGVQMKNEIVACQKHDEDYKVLQQAIDNNFFSYRSEKLFTTNAEGLFEIYLAGIQENEKQHYNCHACKKFIETYGGLVSISEDGKTTPVLWNIETAPSSFRDSVQKLYKAVVKAKVTGIYFDKNDTWGTPVTGEWNHLHVKPARENIHFSALKTPFQAKAEKLENFKTVIRALNEFSLEAVSQAVNLLEQDALYRSEKIIGPAKWLKVLHESIMANKGRKANIVWAAVASAPSGFCHPRSSMIGTLLEDIVEGLPFDSIKRRFADKMQPLQYQRPQSSPTAGNIAEAEKIVEKLGIAKSLERRFATIDEVQTIWRPKEEEAKEEEGGVFAHVEAKNSNKINPIVAPAKTMTWKKFEKEVLPAADSIEFFIPMAYDSYSAILTAQHDDAPAILQWDNEESKNTFSWYLYSCGSHARDWGLNAGNFHKVTGLCFQPSMWNGDEYQHQGAGIMFILDGAKDLRSDNAGNGLFPEILKADLRGIRATLEAYSKKAKIGNQEGASACGMLLQKNRIWNAELRVTSGGMVNKYRLDRWE